MKVSVLVFAFGILSAQANAGSFRHILRGYHLAQGASCEEAAYQIGQSFSAQAGVSDVSTRCVDNWEGRGKKDIEISYQAEKALSIVSTDNPATALSHAATYKTRETCEADLARELPYFQERTQLVPFVSYCETWGSFGDHRLIIKAIGESAIRPYVTTLSTLGTILGYSRETFTSAISLRLQTFNADLAQLAPSSSGINSEMHIRYYGSDALVFDEMVIAKHDVAENCLAKVEAVQAALTAHDNKHLVVYCQNTGINGVELVAQVSRDSDYSIVKAEGDYKTFDECSANLDAVVIKYKERYNHKVVVGACSREGREKFMVNLLEY